MAKRLPRPANPVRVRMELDRPELDRVEDMAHACRLSVASFLRSLAVAVAEEWPDGADADAIKAVAARLLTTVRPGQARPGRPKKGDKKK